ncbi:hypothetical protein BOX15_Mlig015429g1, partial [Macrostomum lignano]
SSRVDQQLYKYLFERSIFFKEKKMNQRASWLSLVVLLVLLLEVGTARALNSNINGIAYLRVGTTDSHYENYCAYGDPSLTFNLSNTFHSSDSKPIIDAYPNNGCNRNNASYANRIVILTKGGCTYVDQAVNAFAQGAIGLIVVSSERYPTYLTAESHLLPKSFQTVVISKVAYQSFKSQFMSDSNVKATLYRPYDDNSGSKQYMFLILSAIALVTMVLSCITAATALKEYLITRSRLASNVNTNSEHEPDVNASAPWWHTAIFTIILLAIPITILLLLNFAYDYFVWVMLVLYGYSVSSSLVYYINRIYLACVKAKLETGPRPWLATTVEFDLGKCCGKISCTYLEFIVYPFCLAIAVIWFVFRNAHWAFILTNILNVVVVLRVIESLAMALRIKIATIIMICFLVYDVFFVFITPLFSGGGGGGSGPSPTNPPSTEASTLNRVRRDTVMDYYVERGGSFMERVALGTAGLSGEIIPIVFKVMPYPPAESIFTCLLPYSILGLGDVIMPAILISLNLFFDLAWKNRFYPYFVSSMIGYLLGLGACAGVLFATGSGQPALLYIVPLILLTSYLCAAIKRELKLYFHTSLPDEYREDNRFDVESSDQQAVLSDQQNEAAVADSSANQNDPSSAKTPSASNSASAL